MAKDTNYIELQQFVPPNGGELESPKQNPSNGKLTAFQRRIVLESLGLAPDAPLERIPHPNQYMIDRIEELDVEIALGILRNALADHSGDVNFSEYDLVSRLMNGASRYLKSPSKDLNLDLKAALREIEEDKTTSGNEYPEYDEMEIKNEEEWAIKVKIQAAFIRYHSIYPEIRSITDPCDDDDTHVETLRVYVIGLVWTLIGSVVNNFFVHRMPSIALGPHTIQILLLPTGKLWERYVPEVTIKLFGFSFDLNSGPWTYKEMMLATIMYSCSAGTPYAIYNIVVMKLDKFYGLKWVTWTFQFLLASSTQFLGFGFALLMKKVCIYPARALWPTILPTIALNRALMRYSESSERDSQFRLSQFSVFYLVFVGSFLYYWIPGYFFTALSNFNWPTWFSPNLIHLINVTGSNEGLGLNPIPSFDWNIIDSDGCLTIPFYTYLNKYIGRIIGFIVILVIYYTDNNWTSYLPINSNHLFDNKGKVYQILKILGNDNLFDETKYQQYGPPYFSAANLVLYGAYFCLYPFAILYHMATEWESMKLAFINIFHTFRDSIRPMNSSNRDARFGRFSEDPHCQMMSKYEEVPDLWFLAVLIVSTVFAVLCVSLYPTETPVWGVFFTIGINLVFLIPITAICSVTGFLFGLNVLVELIVGYAIPNSGLALITLKSYGYNIDNQASNYITDQKLAHYTKLPPKAIFKGQLLSTLLSVFISLLIANWQIDNIPDLCESNQADKLSCPGANTFFYASIQYGEIGPAKVFGGLYPVLKWCFLLGAILVIPCALFKKYGPTNLAKYFQPTIIIGGLLGYAPYNLSYATGGLYFLYFFMYYVKRHYLLWWERYNYILTLALSAGVAFSALLGFFIFLITGFSLDWWGNTISDRGIEGRKGQLAWHNVTDAPDGYIGLRYGSFP
ncbi:uncharacterized protein KQ657_004214 [Scheffersomyces spartinae]|uniref:Oligopeptide transporter n=1 Tax=Scheffersomyces spartinae TaxID=45513 RepID=A0A9P7VC01_9ASCO|nr:uncharacterized protein KQ657_004214 [Scheffersomyces spartinae]KAG7195097.1 hypothetical protein KQ657_004214 [Scheffersomyces spartinae]